MNVCVVKVYKTPLAKSENVRGIFWFSRSVACTVKEYVVSLVVASVMAPDKTPPVVSAVPAGRDDPALRVYETVESDRALNDCENAIVFVAGVNVAEVLHTGTVLVTVKVKLGESTY